ncbi:MAG: nucleotidyltransferase family protein [Clostridium sp.]
MSSAENRPSSINTRVPAWHLCGGADLVVELPALFATSSAEDFAACGVSLLGSLGTDFYALEVNPGNLSHLQKAAEILSEESAIWQSLLQTYLKQGETYPSARSLAVARAHRRPRAFHTAGNTKQHPLPCGYLKALKQQESSMIRLPSVAEAADIMYYRILRSLCLGICDPGCS